MFCIFIANIILILYSQWGVLVKQKKYIDDNECHLFCIGPQFTLKAHLALSLQSAELVIVWQKVHSTISSLNACNSFTSQDWPVVVACMVLVDVDTVGGQVDWVVGQLITGHVGHIILPMVIPVPEIRKTNSRDVNIIMYWKITIVYTTV